MKKIAVFASGSGTNAEQIILHFQNSDQAEVSLLVCNREGAGVIERAKRLSVPVLMISNQELREFALQLVNKLQQKEIDWIVLAGFMRKIPIEMVETFPNRIVNIHPALLPNYGGKGMYGHHVHEAVIQNGESESGITIHYVNERYDEGNIIFQAKCEVFPDDSPDTLASRIHALEHKNYPRVIENLLVT